MAGRWRVLIEGLEDVAPPKYRVGDHLRTLKHQVVGDDMIKDVVVEVGYGDEFQSTNPFGVGSDGKVKLGAVLFVRSPPAGKPLFFNVVKGHRIQKDALIGSADIRGTTEGRRKLTLKRNDKSRGCIIVEVSDGLPSSASPSSGLRSGASQLPGNDNSAAMLPAAAVSRSSRPVHGDSGGGGGGGSAEGGETGKAAGSSAVGGCIDCVLGIMDMLGLRDADQAFLKAKQEDPSVIKLTSGLMYKVIKQGQGKHHASSHDQVKCHYRGKLVNGKVFDSSYDTGGEPVVFRRGQVIAGWKEALGLMVEGDKWELYIPGHLAYGEAGDPSGRIKPNATLWFELELLRIVVARR